MAMQVMIGEHSSGMKGLVALLLLVLAACAATPAIHSDEQVIFFPSFASQTSNGWRLSIHGWVHEPETRPILGAILRRAIPIDRDALTDAERDIYRERTRYFLPDNERRKVVTVRIGSLERDAPPTASDGHFTLRCDLSAREFASLPVSNGCLSVAAVLDQNDSRAFMGSIHVLSNSGWSVISDIDDTIKVSEVRNREALLLNTFCRPFKAVDGMAELYRAWQTNGAQSHYFSASPWQLYIPLAEFVAKAGFPAGTFHMKDFRVKDSRFLALLSDPEKFKLKLIRPFFEQFPERQFVLVGDSGEKDPEIYGQIAREFPNQVHTILIRDVTDENRGSQRYQAAFRNVKEGSWHVFKSAKELNSIRIGVSSSQ
jgi:phosphatidate phosphatase APP1